MRLLCIMLIYSLSFLIICSVSEAGDITQAISAYDVVWDSPSKGSHGSMPIGNGDVGLNVWVQESGDLFVYISKNDAWNEICNLLKLGKLKINFSPNFLENADQFRQELDLSEGRIIITAVKDQKTFKIILWVDAHSPAAYIQCQGSVPITTRVQLENWRTQRRRLEEPELEDATGLGGSPTPVYAEPDTIAHKSNSLVWYHRNTTSIWRDTLELQSLGVCVKRMTDPLLNRTFGCRVQGDNLVSISDTQLETTKPLTHSCISIYAHTSQTDSGAAWLEQIDKRVKAIRSENLKLTYERHCKWWNDFWNRSWIFIRGSADADMVTRGYILSRYISACGGRGKYPIKFNGSIFNFDSDTPVGTTATMGQSWYDADYRRWGGGYWWQNTRLIYWPMLDSGDFDLMMPLFNMYCSAMPLAKERTRMYYDHGGIFFPETMYFWGTYRSRDYGWDRRDKQAGMVNNPYIRYYWQGGIELIAMMLDYYQYTGDEQFARDTLIPLSQEITLFFDLHWKRDGKGKIVFTPAASLETWHTATNPLPEIAGLNFVLPQLLKLKPGLVSQEQRQRWKKLLDSLPPLPLKQEDGKRYLLPAQSFESKMNIENPELYAVFPYRLYGIGKPDLDIALETFTRRLTKASGGWFQDAIDAACLGLAQEAWHNIVNNFRPVAGTSDRSQDPNCRFAGFWGPNADWTPDQDQPSVAMIALQRMLLQPDGDKILLFPAWPHDLDVEFKLRTSHNTVIEASLKNGKAAVIQIEPVSRQRDVHSYVQ